MSILRINRDDLIQALTFRFELTGSDWYLDTEAGDVLLANDGADNGRRISVKITVEFPLSFLSCVTGVSGSGNPTFVNDTRYPIAARRLSRAHYECQDYTEIEGLDDLDKVVEIDQRRIVSYNKEARILRIWDGNSQQPITQEVFSP